MSGRRIASSRVALRVFAVFVCFAGPVRADIVPDARPTLELSRLHPLISRRDDVPDSTFQNHSAAFPSVGFLDRSGTACSGVLIAPNAVLTAGHCIFPGAPGSAYKFTIGGNTYTGLSTFLPPDWTTFQDSIGKGNDIGIVLLTANVTNVAPARLYMGTDEVGRVGTDVGFGFPGTGTNGQGGFTGTKRAGDNMIDALGTFYTNVSAKIVLQDFDNPAETVDVMGSKTPLALESLITQGDSGGAMFADFGDGPLVVAIHSFLDDFNEDGKLSNYGDIGGSTRVSQHLGFIGSIVPSAVPEPSSVALCGLGLIVAAAWGRRSRRRAA